jgi:hypothetical protein
MWVRLDAAVGARVVLTKESKRKEHQRGCLRATDPLGLRRFLAVEADSRHLQLCNRFQQSSPGERWAYVSTAKGCVSAEYVQSCYLGAKNPLRPQMLPSLQKWPPGHLELTEQ